MMLGLTKVVFFILLSGMLVIGRAMESGRHGLCSSSGWRVLEFFSALPANYRPISLLSCLSKVYEFVLLQRLNQHCTAANFIIPQQCGFRPKCSTVHQLLRVTELIHSGFAKHEDTGYTFSGHSQSLRQNLA
ncbi:RNA-directed DNA polymerase from mobile element jockey [Trichonephila clavipes]|nr:RNA-directed DNA polymerase from mobile element jockey [Trichonephila clavipes]